MSNNKTYKIWENFFISKGITPLIREQYLSYIDSLLKKNVPIIFTFEHLRHLLGREKRYFASVVNSPQNHYREFKIKKRNGGIRIITTPYPALLEMQYWIYNNILLSIPVHSSAHGFVKNKSIITNSKIHVGKENLLKLDLKDFFPSISLNRIIGVFKNLGYPNHIAFYLASICSYNQFLPQGAPTSPALSNIIAYNLDKRLIMLAKKFGYNYTRYADDITFSGKSIPAIFIKYIKNIIITEGFEVNNSKTRLYKNKTKRIVTGISVVEDNIKLPREYKRKLKQELHYIFKYGLDSHVSKKKIRNPNYLISIIGKVSFWLSVEPNNKYANDMKQQLLIILSNT